MSEMAIFRQLMSERNVSDLEEQGRPHNQRHSGQTQSPKGHFVGMPASLFPAISKTVEVCPYAVWTKDHRQTESEESNAHNECCGAVT